MKESFENLKKELGFVKLELKETDSYLQKVVPFQTAGILVDSLNYITSTQNDWSWLWSCAEKLMVWYSLD